METREQRLRAQRGLIRRRTGTERMLGWMLCLAGAVLGISVVVRYLQQRDEYAELWNACGLVLVGVIVLLAAVGSILPLGLVTALWWTVSVAGPLLLLLSYSALRMTPQQAVDADPPWLLQLEAVFVSLPVLLVRPIAAIVWSLVSATFSALSALLFLGEVPSSVLAATALCLGNVAFVVIFLGIDRQLRDLERSEQLVLQRETERANASAHSAAHEKTSRLVHDEILSVLTVAMHTSGVLPPEVRAMARRADALPDRNRDDEVSGTDDAPISSASAIALVRLTVQPIDPAFMISEEAEFSTIPRGVARTIGAAAAEAARNSVRHSGREAKRWLSMWAGAEGMVVVIGDDGRGFDPDGVALDRTGIRKSIIERMESVGGSARVRSSAGAGTVVEIEWYA